MRIERLISLKDFSVVKSIKQVDIGFHLLRQLRINRKINKLFNIDTIIQVTTFSKNNTIPIITL